MIKDQCNKCKFVGTCQITKIFDSTSCPDYVHQIDLEKHAPPKIDEQIGQGRMDLSTDDESIVDIQDSSEDVIITREYLKQKQDMQGWLKFCLFCIVVGGIVSAIYPIATYDEVKYGGSTMLAMSDVLAGLLLCALSFITLYAFVERKPDAVFLAKTYIVFVFVSNLLSLFNGNFDSTGLNTLAQSVKSLIWSGVWFCYLCWSKQIKEIIPVKYRKINGFDIAVLAIMIVVPLLFIAIGIQNVNRSRSQEIDKNIQTAFLLENERTDGKVTFAIPNGFTCVKNDANGLIVHTMENDSIGNITLCSDYDSDHSDSNIDTYWTNWEDADMKQYSSNVILDEVKSINGFTYHSKVKLYNIEESIIFWRFIILFDSASMKVCVISCYDLGYNQYLDELLESIRFH